MIYVGIDDTDVLGSRGTNQLAKALAAELPENVRCVRIVRHQLLEDPRVRCTSKNGSASLQLESRGPARIGDLAAWLASRIRADHIEGSDPGLCVAEAVPGEVIDFGRGCQRRYVLQAAARRIAAAGGLYLEGLGGTQDGVIGALAAVGLAATHDDGRVVKQGPWPDDLSGHQPVASIVQRGVEIRECTTGRLIQSGRVDVGKRLRPNRRAGKDVLFVQRAARDSNQDRFLAVRLP